MTKKDASPFLKSRDDETNFCIKTNCNTIMSKFFFNKLFIIQSLVDSDRKTGNELENIINDWAKVNQTPIQAVLFNVETKEEWETTWNGIYTSIRDCANIPIIHLVMHGNENYVGIKKGYRGLIPLRELFDKVRKANELSRNNIFLSMAVCKGLNVIRSLSVSKHMPFCGLLASEDSLLNDETLANYTLFYKSFFTKLNIDEAKAELQANGIHPELYKLSKPEEIFMNAMCGYLESQSKDDKIEERAKTIANMGNLNISDGQEWRVFVETVRKLVKEEDEKHYQLYVSTFFMFDLYPEIEDRFQVPKTLAEFKEMAKNEGMDLY